jgi:AraC-like DNA-binding protein
MAQRRVVAVQRPALAVFPAGARMPERELAEHELVWMLDGSARLTGEQPLDLRVGDVLVLPPGVRHGITWLGGPAGTPTRHGYVHFDCTGPAAVVTRVRATRDDPLAGLTAYLLWLGSRREPGDASLRRTVEYVLDVVLEGDLPHAEEPGPFPEPLLRCLIWWRSVWSEPPLAAVPAADLARAAHMSVSQLNRLFARAIGTGPASAVSRLRCAHAEDLLLRTDLPLASVARACGYADAAHLSHRFRALHGVAPRDYRARGTGVSMLDDPGLRRIAHLVWHT